MSWTDSSPVTWPDRWRASGCPNLQDENTAARFSQPHCGSEPVWPESDDHGIEATVGHVT
ncbi:hypothetical protein I552_10124 [Mycobacterium xenopi 3993]|nr:hypothetical protein I552_10124 [Mycobacterium xenopi 3993]